MASESGISSPDLPPPPPPAPSNKEILAKLEAKGMDTMDFYMNGKPIKASEARRILKNDEADRIQIQQSQKGRSVVKLAN